MSSYNIIIILERISTRCNDTFSNALVFWKETTWRIPFINKVHFQTSWQWLCLSWLVIQWAELSGIPELTHHLLFPRLIAAVVSWNFSAIGRIFASLFPIFLSELHFQVSNTAASQRGALPRHNGWAEHSGTAFAFGLCEIGKIRIYLRSQSNLETLITWLRRIRLVNA